MDCRSFKKKHPAYLDDTLSGVDTAAMQEHLRRCPVCARQDSDIRRSLLLFRNLPRVEPSAGFTTQLRARLATEKPLTNHADHFFRGPSVGMFVGVATSVIAIGMFSVVVAGSPSISSDSYPRVPSVATLPVDSLPELVATDVAAPAYAASMSTGMPMWPALLLVEEGSLRFATTELRPVSLRVAPEQ